MKNDSFCHLHVHSEFSLLDGACRIADLGREVEQMGMSAAAITDHGNMFGVVSFYDALQESGVKPIIGYEGYLTMGDRRARDYAGGQRELYHLTLLARDRTGYKNLLKLSSLAYLEGLYYKPRIDRELLQDCSAGLICLSGWLPSRINQLLLAGAEGGAEQGAWGGREG